MKMQKAPPRKFAINGFDRDIFGTAELCTWPVAPGVCRFQTRSPEFARKLSQRSGAKLVGWSVMGDYLRIFQEPIEPWRARQFVTRTLMPTNGAFLGSKRPRSRRNFRGGSQQRQSQPWAEITI